MPGKKPKQPKRRLDHIALTPPMMTVVSDHALLHGACDDDCFDLTYKLGPVFDILRYPRTRTPMAIAIYGDWGSGKTSAMEWLHGLVERWNEEGQADDKVCVKPVWFYPWKYHTKEDVWRGLIAEVIIESIKIKGASRAEIVSAAKQFGLFLGRGFIHIMAGLTLKAKAKTPVAEMGVEADLAGLKDILEDYRDTTHPERAYLNDFESGLRDWINSRLNENERMVIFIDDLDRCMPDIALEVLEALKLYLNIPRLIFVVGVDRRVINDLVTKYYEKLGVREEQSKNYLAKMFQVEVEVSPHEHQVENFLDLQLREVTYWQQELTPDERDMFRRMILKFAGRNPREIKRQVNGALMAASGAMMVSSADAQYTFKQGLQVHFVKKVLEQVKYSRASLVGSKLGDEFFGAWSKAAASSGEGRIVVPQDFIEQQRGPDSPTRLTGKKADTQPSIDMNAIRPASFAPAQYMDLMENRAWAELLPLLADADLAKLMRIPYPTNTRPIGVVTGDGKQSEIVREAVARSLRKKTEELTPQDYAEVTELDLAGAELTGMEPLRSLSALQWLDLNGTQVTDLEPLRSLSALQELYLSGTQVTDLEPLRNLSALQTLDLDGTQVTNLEPIRNLSQLQTLFLDETKVTDLEPLASLSNLQDLFLNEAKVADLEPLKSLYKLQFLSLNRTPVTNLEPLRGLSRLQVLWLGGTPVTDLEPLRGLSELNRLILDGTHVTDLEPLTNLSALEQLILNRTQVTALEPLRNLPKLEVLLLRETKVTDDQIQRLKEALPDVRVFR